MDRVREKVAPAGTVVGAVAFVISLVLDGIGAVSLGLPFWAWEAIAAAVFFVSVMAIIVAHERDVEKRIGEAEPGKQSVAEPFALDPYSIITKLAGVDLSGLFKPESYMVFTLNVRNVSGHPIEITGAEGRIRCCGEECNMPLTVERKPRKLPSSDSLVRCAIRQPIGNGMLQMIDQKRIQLYGSLVFDLSSLKWTGSVESPGGRVSLENCYLRIDSFVVQGPIRGEEDGATLFTLQAKFLSSNHYLSDGRRKEGD